MAKFEEYIKSPSWHERFPSDEEESDGISWKFSPQQIKNLKIYVLGMEGDKRHITLKRGIAKLNSNKPLNADEAGSVKDFCLDVLDGNTTKFKALMG